MYSSWYYAQITLCFSVYRWINITINSFLIEVKQHLEATLALGNLCGSCETTTSVHFTKGWLCVCLSVCVPHMWISVLICVIFLLICLLFSQSIYWKKRWSHRKSLLQFKTWIFEEWCFWTKAADNTSVFTFKILILKRSVKYFVQFIKQHLELYIQCILRCLLIVNIFQ